MKLNCLQGRTADGYTTFGGYWEKGEVKDNAFSLTAADGSSVPVQSRPMAYWPDGSTKWSAHTADAAEMAYGADLQPIPCVSSANTGNTVFNHTVRGIQIADAPDHYMVDTGRMSLTVPKGAALPADCLATAITRKGQPLIRSIYPVFVLERHSEDSGVYQTTDREYRGIVTEVSLEESGPLQAVFCFRGFHVPEESCTMPFVIRMYLWADSTEMKFVHTFLFNGSESRDYLKGMGVRFELSLAGEAYQHHIQYSCGEVVFHEPAIILHSRRPRLWYDVEAAQMSGGLQQTAPTEDITRAISDLPRWDHYQLYQDSAFHYRVYKRTKPECCWLNGKEGNRSDGVMAVTGTEGGLLLGIRDFWQKYPSAVAADGLGTASCTCTAWFYSPLAAAYDFRHYDTKSYPETCYEGFEEVNSTAYGIGVTSECRASLTDDLPNEETIHNFSNRLQKPAVFTASPDYYYEKRAFGAWSKMNTDTKATQKMEHQLELAFDFYKQEVECRGWYGLFDYGDVMHSYDRVRHCWYYDVGGFAWQNTELVPTYWLWLYFLRTGREDVFSLAEAMSRHTSEVDLYHFGPLKGLGSRHNVRHWGCSCKEPRIAMAGHHRFLFYLTGDARLGDVMEDVKDADLAMSANPHSQETLADGTVMGCARSGPDWSSYVSNWMTHYERTLDEDYRKKIETGIRDIAATPYGFASGPDYYYDPATAHLIYHGEIEDTPNQHLQVCMGGPQIWLETADMLGDDTLKKMLERLGAFYYLPQEEKRRLTDGRIEKRPFSNIELVTSVTAYSAKRSGDTALARQTWKILLENLVNFTTPQGFLPDSYVPGQPAECYQEIAGISTNSTAQWCLNVMMCLEFIPDSLPDDLSF